MLGWVLWLQAISQPLIAISPLFVVCNVSKSPRSVVFWAPETFLLLSAAYLLRYQEIYLHLFSFQHGLQKIHLIGLFTATCLILHHLRQARLSIRKSRLSLERDTTQDEDSEISTIQSESFSLEPEWAMLTAIAIAMVLLSLYFGEHSLSARAVRWYKGRPNGYFWQDFCAQLVYMSYWLELNALPFQYLRSARLHYLSNGKSQVETEEGRKKWKALRMTKALWGFIMSSQLGVAVSLPSSVEKVMASAEDADDVLVNGIFSGCLQILMLGAFLTVLKWGSERWARWHATEA
ncbi:uncharacterized protein UTRI_10685 [Ustilago trichophora]|uniref:Uncharacterized protein n=1 Tax=Ustilago trichophora TaxID=86804 RepID=A0A5C3E9Y1_9BASI|nr:uncharacterized protein UTRI_10685 [Ustilago trichophora]